VDRKVISAALNTPLAGVLSKLANQKRVKMDGTQDPPIAWLALATAMVFAIGKANAQSARRVFGVNDATRNAQVDVMAVALRARGLVTSVKRD
jgi:hypothetical protein